MKKAITIDNTSYWGNFNIALLKLLKVMIRQGWKNYEKRDKDQYLSKYGGSAIQEIFKE